MTKPKSYYHAQPDHQAQRPGDRFLSTAAVVIRYDKSASSVARWQGNPALGFPVPIQIVAGGPNLYSEAELDAFDRRRAAEAPEERRRRSEQARERRLASLKATKPALTAAPAGDDGAAAAAANDTHLLPQQEQAAGRPPAAGKRPPVIVRHPLGRPLRQRLPEEEEA